MQRIAIHDKKNNYKGSFNFSIQNIKVVENMVVVSFHTNLLDFVKEKAKLLDFVDVHRISGEISRFGFYLKDYHYTHYWND